ncbi:transposase [Streptomyces sp. NPDC056013]|uniref:transposase n=1 Tax=Streptomyces sp. NPDC056013 TaxID=3345680 RepID=UPI0035E21D61
MTTWNQCLPFAINVSLALFLLQGELMTSKSRFTAAERADFADQVIDGGRTIREVADECEVPRQTVQNWVKARRNERGIPTPRPGSGASTPERMAARQERLEKARAEFEARAEKAEARTASLETIVARQRSAIAALKETLRLYMDPDGFEDGTAAA